MCICFEHLLSYMGGVWVSDETHSVGAFGVLSHYIQVDIPATVCIAD